MDNTENSRIVYEASVRALQDQTSVLDGLRSRAGTLLAAAALVSSFLGGQALRDIEHVSVSSFAGIAVGGFVAAAALTLVILWPFEFHVRLGAQNTFDAIADHSGDGPLAPSELYRVLALQLEWTYDQNRVKIRWLFWAFELAIVFLAVEVAAWIVVLWRA